MSVANAIPEYWVTALKKRLYPGALWRMLPDDRSVEVMRVPGGNKFTLNMYNATVSVGDYTRFRGTTTGTTRTVPRGTQPVTTATEFTLDQNKEIILEFDDLDHIQANPTLFDRHVAEGARQLGFTLDDYLRTQNIDSLANANQYVVSGINTTGKRKEFRQLCMDWIQQTAVMADRDNWPADQRVIVGMPEFTDAIVSYLTNDKPNLGMGQIVDEAFRDHGVA